MLLITGWLGKYEGEGTTLSSVLILSANAGY